MTDRTWHYQLIRHFDDEGDPYFGVHEYLSCEYGVEWDDTPVFVEGDTVEQVKWMLKAMLECIEEHGVIDDD